MIFEHVEGIPMFEPQRPLEMTAATYSRRAELGGFPSERSILVGDMKPPLEIFRRNFKRRAKGAIADNTTMDEEAIIDLEEGEIRTSSISAFVRNLVSSLLATVRN